MENHQKTDRNNPPPQEENQTLPAPPQTLKSLLIFLCSLGLGFVAQMGLIPQAAPPDTARLEKLYAFGIWDFQPETEIPRLIVFAAVFVACLVLFSLFCRINIAPIASIRPLLAAILLFAAITAFLTFFFQPKNKEVLLYYAPPKATLTLLFPFLAVVLVGVLLPKIAEKLDHMLRFLPHIIAGISILLFCSRYNQTDFVSTYLLRYHFTATYNPIYEISAGHTLGVDFSPLYGFYAYVYAFLETLLFNKVSMIGTIMLYGATLTVAAVAFYITVCCLTKNRWLPLFTIPAIFFFQFRSLDYDDNFPYYQYFPLRVVMPCVTLALIALFVRTQKKGFQIAAFASCGFALFWNPETGIVSLLTVLGFSIFENLRQNKLQSKLFWINIIKIGGGVLGSVLFWLFALEILTKIRSGSFFDPQQIFWSMEVFGAEGFFMLSIPKGHPFWVLVLGYCIAVAVPLLRLKNLGGRGSRRRDALAFVIGLVGFGTMLYFFGRSHMQVFPLVVYPFFLLLPWFFENAMLLVRRCKHLGVRAAGVLLSTLSLIFLFGFAVGMVFQAQTESFKQQAKRIAAPDAVLYPETTAFMRAYETEHMAVLHPFSSSYMDVVQPKNEWIGPCLIDFFFKQDYLDLVHFVESYKGRLFIESNMSASPLMFDDSETLGQKLEAVLSSRYTKVDEGQGLTVYDSR